MSNENKTLDQWEEKLEDILKDLNSCQNSKNLPDSLLSKNLNIFNAAFKSSGNLAQVHYHISDFNRDSARRKLYFERRWQNYYNATRK